MAVVVDNMEVLASFLVHKLPFETSVAVVAVEELELVLVSSYNTKNCDSNTD